MLINGVLFWVLVKVLPGIEIQGILPAVLAPVTYTVLTVLIQTYGSHINVIDSVKSLASSLSGVKEQMLEEPTEPKTPAKL